ncbi:hypothetical protein SAMN04515674_10427 [Pseudarcicella hirudinis]|uniref:Uncharacterized protein n=1 Tax=Pseudarcicella hirudinis TaxID=1079859 RepID=A0A1I5RDW4_9BACT|nr:hypothetical protein SAMN04515674_10427 [Pseudarcicella hirudinis]
MQRYKFESIAKGNGYGLIEFSEKKALKIC